MWNYIRKFIFISLVLFSVNLPAVSYGFSFNQIVIFGDSLSDEGLLYSYDMGMLPKSPPYFKGRFSNGIVWSEILGDYFHSRLNMDIENYAVGGETVILQNPFAGYLPYTFSESLNSYYWSTISNNIANALVIIWIGANDYLQGAEDVDGTTSNVVKSVRESIEELINKGAKNLLIVDLPDLAKTPKWIGTEGALNVHALIEKHNKKLTDAIIEIQRNSPSVTIKIFNSSTVFNDLVTNPQSFNEKFHTHINNVSGTCWDGGYTVKRKQAFTKKMSKNTNGQLGEAFDIAQRYAEGDTPCNDPDSFVFWDHVHPTEVVQTMLADYLIRFVNENFH